MAYLKVRVSPGARRDQVSGWLGDTLKLRVKAAPERGKANGAVVTLVAAVLGIPESRITIERGASSRDKLLRIDGLSDAQLRADLAAPGEAHS